jgi:hypothetical protein
MLTPTKTNSDTSKMKINRHALAFIVVIVVCHLLAAAI